ncbi:hypothetical protein B0H11DRAFT_1920560 [Mycena galericulata]|nr:hypothetical protein B0H11DRAFT_1920560 [Mycena galericulata]
MSASMPLDFSLAPEEAVSLLDEISKLRCLLSSSSSLEGSPELPGLLNFEEELRSRCQPILSHPGLQQSPSASAAPLGLLHDSEEEDTSPEHPYALVLSTPTASQPVNSLNSRSPSPMSLVPFLLPSFLPPSLNHLTTAPPVSNLTPWSPSFVLGKRITVTRPESFDGEEPPVKKSFTGIKWRIPVLRPAVGGDEPGSMHDSDSESSSSSDESCLGLLKQITLRREIA